MRPQVEGQRLSHPNAIAAVQATQSDSVRQAEEELANVEAQIVDAELRLATLKQQLALFEKRYRKVAAGLCEELDRLNSRIAALCIDRVTSHEGPGRKQAYRSQNTTELPPDDALELPEFLPSESLQKLYREAAKRFHPDLAEDDADRVWRTQMMQLINSAYASGDSEKLQSLLERSRHTQTLATVEDSLLVRIKRKTARLRSRLDELVREQTEIETSDLGQLYAKARKAGRDSADFLRNLVIALKAEIEERKQLLEELLNKETLNERKS